MVRLKNWILANKFTTLLLLLVLYFLGRSLLFTTILGTSRISNYDMGMMGYEAYDSAGYAVPSSPSMGMGMQKSLLPIPGGGGAPQLNVENRMTVTSSQMSILVKNVQESVDGIQGRVRELGGYVINSNIHSPTEGGTGNVTIRLPVNKREEMLSYLRTFGVKVVSENIDSSDVTDEYVDIDGRLATLRTTKARYEQIMESAVDVAEILRVQQHIFQVQDEIDRLVGRQRYLEATSQSTVITVHLSTDELALPYAPEQPWRPEVIFKLAVRSLLGVFQSLGTALIWLGVFSVLWIPLFLVFIAIRKYRRKHTA